MTKKELEIIKGIVNEVVVENNKVLLAKMESMEKRIDGLSIDNAVGTKTKATSKSPKSSTPTKSAKTKTEATPLKVQEVKEVKDALAEELGYDVVEVKYATKSARLKKTYFIRQMRYMKDRKYREEAMNREGRLRTDKGFEKFKCYEFSTLEAVKTALKAVKKSKDAYKKSVANA